MREACDRLAEQEIEDHTQEERRQSIGARRSRRLGQRQARAVISVDFYDRILLRHVDIDRPTGIQTPAELAFDVFESDAVDDESPLEPESPLLPVLPKSFDVDDVAGGVDPPVTGGTVVVVVAARARPAQWCIGPIDFMAVAWAARADRDLGGGHHGHRHRTVRSDEFVGGGERFGDDAAVQPPVATSRRHLLTGGGEVTDHRREPLGLRADSPCAGAYKLVDPHHRVGTGNLVVAA